MSKKQTCRECHDVKSIEAFRKFGRIIAEKTGRSHSDQCLQCETTKARARKKARQEVQAEEAVPPDPNQPRLSVPFSMAVDIAWDGVDFVLSQENEGTVHTIYVAPHVVTELAAFAEKIKAGLTTGLTNGTGGAEE